MLAYYCSQVFRPWGSVSTPQIRMSSNETVLRIVFITVLVSVILISGTYRRRARQSGDVIQRRQEGAVILALRMGFGLPLLLALLLYVFYPPWLDWSHIILPDWLRWVAAGLAALCIPLAWWVFRSIGNNISETILTKRTHQLVTVGPYRWVRHPLYAVSMLLLLTLSVIASNWFLGLYWLLTVLVFRFIVIPKEEGVLINTFGDRYLSYRRGTGALLPKVFGRGVT